MEGLANECYNLIVNQRQMGASYSTVFNMAWYALKPLPLGNKYKINASRITAEGQGVGDMFTEPDWNRVSICTIED